MKIKPIPTPCKRCLTELTIDRYCDKCNKIIPKGRIKSDKDTKSIRPQ